MKTLLATLIGTFLMTAGHFAEAGCRPCGHNRACCTEESCRKCDDDAELLKACASIMPAGGKFCEQCPSENENCMPRDCSQDEESNAF